nr:hypothetical protein Iba_chr14cCG1310 [Ipomoea batatas]
MSIVKHSSITAEKSEALYRNQWRNQSPSNFSISYALISQIFIGNSSRHIFNALGGLEVEDWFSISLIVAMAGAVLDLTQEFKSRLDFWSEDWQIEEEAKVWEVKSKESRLDFGSLKGFLEEEVEEGEGEPKMSLSLNSKGLIGGTVISLSSGKGQREMGAGSEDCAILGAE